ncbi:ABC-F family ATP-binding cassette domain-containing protein [Acetilactobacillus jinshanensis]|uniref:ABC-F family ATP-binding cassette domain-containing protein n=1 Tax=Acetilactobacillus jinshanensis TaxID=1720083 RepID=A0A4P6ZJS7_9LACO|nr:ABC-F family ATP-binding cassette domain-containing protein [Acetilactobacillus jinshanensis]QBP17793.1 ABC-F family ATP-binding cassette domain-containing protein [Acetilactobacillus jinshanensis]URL60656.1 ABC-F family ATP-binding cassette domain-containing protein [uncultured bacterium]
MALLDVKNLTMSFADKTLYKHANFTLNKGEHMGVVGQNGVGKSTLIKLITGAELPLTGQIKWQKGVKIGYLDQYVNIPKGMTLMKFLHTAYSKLYDMNDHMNQLYKDYAKHPDNKLMVQAGRIQETLEAHHFYDIETKINEVITGLGLDDIGKNQEVSKMSGGQRSKIILAKVILEKPNVILLDEPTNYLDVAHVDWLIDYLNNFSGTFMVISHDYDFLEKITNCILNIAFGHIKKYRGDFKKAMRQKTAEEKFYKKAYDKQQVKIAKAKTFIRKNRAGSNAKMAKSREKMLGKIHKVAKPSKDIHASFNFPYYDTGSQNALSVKKLSVGYDGKPLLSPVTFTVTTDEKIGLKGFNGVGKSTLIKTILGMIPAISGHSKFSPSAKVNYFSQDLVWPHPEETPLHMMEGKFPNLTQKVLRTKLAKCGLDSANAMKPMQELSGGEQTKVKLSLMEFKPSNFLIMDEPTNHLDAETRASLKAAIKNFPGNAIIVSHEVGFYDGLCDRVLNVEKLSLQNPDLHKPSEHA